MSFLIISLSTWGPPCHPTVRAHSLPRFKLPWQLVQQSGPSLTANQALLPSARRTPGYQTCMCVHMCACMFMSVQVCTCAIPRLKITPVIPNTQTNTPPASLPLCRLSCLCLCADISPRAGTRSAELGNGAGVRNTTRRRQGPPDQGEACLCSLLVA